MRDYVSKVRRNINKFLYHCISELQLQSPVLDIAPIRNAHSTKLFSKKFNYFTLSIDPLSSANITADICKMPEVADESFNVIICTDVLEHTLDPFSAASELYRILKPGGYCLVSTPFNLRIHGPSPDCWRFTEQGLRILFKDKFKIVQIRSIVPLLRRAMPIHYTVILMKEK